MTRGFPALQAEPVAHGGAGPAGRNGQSGTAERLRNGRCCAARAAHALLGPPPDRLRRQARRPGGREPKRLGKDSAGCACPRHSPGHQWARFAAWPRRRRRRRRRRALSRDPLLGPAASSRAARARATQRRERSAAGPNPLRLVATVAQGADGAPARADAGTENGSRPLSDLLFHSNLRGAPAHHFSPRGHRSLRSRARGAGESRGVSCLDAGNHGARLESEGRKTRLPAVPGEQVEVLT